MNWSEFMGQLFSDSLEIFDGTVEITREKKMIEGNIFITGGAGYLGRGIIKRATDENWPCSITVFSRDEVKHAKLKAMFPHIKTIRGDVAGDFDHLMTAMTGHDVVIHAAATKVIPVAEFNVIQTIRDNVIGSINVAQAAALAGVKKCIGISTDKTCHAVNRYGATKYLMEGVFQEAQSWDYPTNFYLTRYGNVLDSTMSVLNLWRDLLEKDGYITATDPDMSRFWLSVDQAVDIILAAFRQPSGTITVPILPALLMSDMAKYTFPDAEFKYMGLRPGEKRYEELLTKEERPFAVLDEKEMIFCLFPNTAYEPHKPDSWVDGYNSMNPITWLNKEQFLEIAGWNQ